VVNEFESDLLESVIYKGIPFLNSRKKGNKENIILHDFYFQHEYFDGVNGVEEYIIPIVPKLQNGQSSIEYDGSIIILVKTKNWFGRNNTIIENPIFIKHTPFELYFKTNILKLKFNWRNTLKSSMELLDTEFFNQCLFTIFDDYINTYLTSLSFSIFEVPLKELLRSSVNAAVDYYVNGAISLDMIDFFILSLLPQTKESIKIFGNNMDMELINYFNDGVISSSELENYYVNIAKNWKFKQL